MPRQDSPIYAEATPELKRLVRAMRGAKASANLSYTKLADLAHYSTASLSLAASGRKLPTWDVTWAYVCGCDSESEKDDWVPLWEAARDAEERRTSEASGAAEPDSTPRRRADRRRTSVADLVREEIARQQTLPFRASDVDATRTALALCTSAEDFRALLDDLRGELSPDELKDRAREKGWSLPKSEIHTMLDGDGVPDTEQLHAFLLACNVSQGQVHEWHHTATRLKISQARVNEPRLGEPFFFRISHSLRRARGHLNLNTAVGLATLVIAILQIITMLKWGSV